MVDAAIGGKTGVNARGGKNRVGAFHSARLVWASLATLSTLPQRAARAGLAEVVKVALVADAPLFALVEEQAEQLAALDPESLGLVVAGAARAKLAVVARDPLERGERVCLNAGHTVGHAIEAVSGFRVPHGEAVARGLVAELRWGEGRGVTRTGLADRVERVLRRLRLPVHVRVRPGLVDALALDKKASADRLVVPVPTDVGCWEPVPLAWAEAGTLVASR
jgi:3-dehydroquinate synthase